MYLTPNEKEREKATGLRMFSEIVGVLLAGGIMAAIISFFDINAGNCLDDNTTNSLLSTSNNLVSTTTLSDTASTINRFQKQVYKFLSLFLKII